MNGEESGSEKIKMQDQNYINMKSQHNNQPMFTRMIISKGYWLLRIQNLFINWTLNIS